MDQSPILSARDTEPLKGGPSFSVSNRMYRLIWGVTWILFSAWTPSFLFGWRRMLLRLFGAQMAPTARVYSSARIWSPQLLDMRAFSCLGPKANCYNIAKVTIGPGAIVSQGAHLCTGSHDIDSVDFQLIAAPIEIGASAWVAAEAFVGPGVSLGEGAVLGARAVAFKDLPPWSVFSGNPAQFLRRRQKANASEKSGRLDD